MKKGPFIIAIAVLAATGLAWRLRFYIPEQHAPTGIQPSLTSTPESLAGASLGTATSISNSGSSSVSEATTTFSSVPATAPPTQEQNSPSPTSTFVDIEGEAFYQRDINMHSSPVELQLIDTHGQRLGYVSSGTDAYEIPFGNYFLDDPTGADVSASLRTGVYQLKVFGRTLGTYVLSPSWYVPATGSKQSGWQEPIYGLSDVGSEDDYEVVVGDDPPSAVVTQVATISSTRQDIDTCLGLGLLDSSDTAEALWSTWLSKANTVSSSPDKVELLNLFRAQTAGEDVRGLAAQVLLRDADSLIDEAEQN